MLRDTLYDIAADTSCSWRFYVFLVGSFLLSEISPLAPSIGWSESLKQENLKSFFFFPVIKFHLKWYRAQWPAGCLRKLQISHLIAYFCDALHKVILWKTRNCFRWACSLNLISGENNFQNFKPLSQNKNSEFWSFRKTGNFYTHFAVWAVEVKWHMVRFLCYTSL